MGKYEPLRQFLTGRREASARVTFREIEDILGFRLPASARKHPPWWSNSGGTHTQSCAWLTAGWKTSQVDIPGEMVTFTRDIERRETGRARTAPGVSESGTAFLGEVINVPVDRLTPAGQALVERYAQEEGGDVVAAIARALQEAAMAQSSDRTPS